MDRSCRVDHAVVLCNLLTDVRAAFDMEWSAADGSRRHSATLVGRLLLVHVDGSRLLSKYDDEGDDDLYGTVATFHAVLGTYTECHLVRRHTACSVLRSSCL